MSEVPLQLNRRGTLTCRFQQTWRGSTENNYSTEMCCGSEAGSYSRPIDFCNKEEEKKGLTCRCQQTWGGSTLFVSGPVSFLPAQRPRTGGGFRLEND